MKKHLVLIGGGHAHMVTLTNLHQFTAQGYGVTVIGPSDHHYYSGMGPGMLGKTYRPEEIRFAVKRMTETRGGTFVTGKAQSLDPDRKIVRLEDGQEISYDVASCNAGSYVPGLEGLNESENIFAVKPIERLQQAQKKIIELGEHGSGRVAIIGGDGQIVYKEKGKISALEKCLPDTPIEGSCGIAHTRWATHGEPNTVNSHPHMSENAVAVVHNGIIENHDLLREELAQAGYVFESETDTEVMAHLVRHLMTEGEDLFGAVRKAVKRLRGAYAIAVLSSNEPGVVVGARAGSPLVLGVGFREHFLASDIHPLLAVTNRFIYLEEGDLAGHHCRPALRFSEHGDLVGDHGIG